MKNTIADMTVYDAHGQLAFIIEVKNKLGTSREWAAKMRRNIFAHGLVPDTKWFIIALPDHFYVWKDIESKPEEILPTYDMNPEPFLRPYYDKAGMKLDQLSEKSLELILTSWLNEMAHTDTIPSSIPSETQQWLAESGFLDAIKDGYIEAQSVI